MQAVLLKARWNLIQTGTDRKLIKIRNNCIYVNRKLYGSVTGSHFNRADNNDNNSAKNDDVSKQSQVNNNDEHDSDSESASSTTARSS